VNVRNRERGFWFLVSGACVAAAGLAVGLAFAFTGGSAPAPAARARSYTDFQACLLAGDRGLADPAAAPLWAGMQQASLATHAKVSYLTVAGPRAPDHDPLSGIVTCRCYCVALSRSL
jgi:hypothetical protein